MFEIRLTRDAETGNLPPLATNGAVLEAWQQSVRARLSPNTLEGYRGEVKRFLATLDANGVLATQVKPSDLAQYVDAYGQRCRSYQYKSFQRRQWVCVKRLDIKQCGMQCPAYEPVDYEVVRSHLRALNSLYDFLAWRGYLAFDPLDKVKEHWLADNKGRKRENKRRKATQDEVERLVNFTPEPNYKLVYALSPKTGYRHEEILTLKVTPEYLDFEAGWIRLPKRRQTKRRGNHDIPLDADMKRLLEWYMQWWARTVKRDAQGRPVHDSLVIAKTGMPMAYDRLNERMAEDCLRLGINKPDMPQNRRLTHHGFRHYYSDTIRTNRCEPFMWHVLRGDKPPGTLGIYNHETPEQIKAEYEKVRPQFHINMPSIYVPRSLPPVTGQGGVSVQVS